LIVSACGSNRLISFSPADTVCIWAMRRARDQRPIMVDLGTPALDSRLGALRQLGGDRL
jgi:hypothetical protein